MKLVELTCFKLIERGLLSGAEAKIVKCLADFGTLNALQLAEFTGEELREVNMAASSLLEKKLIQCIEDKFIVADVLAALDKAIELSERELNIVKIAC